MNTVPEGLVTSTGAFSADIAGCVDVADISRLWKVYTTNPRAHRGTAGYRLENLFWRIWSSDQLLSKLDGSTLASLFEFIIEDRPWGGEQQTTTKPPGTRLPPILKKRHSPQADLPKTTRLLLPGPDGQSLTRSPSNPLTPVLSDRRTGRLSSKQKKTLAVATVKRRPAPVPRRHSSRSHPTQTQIHSPQDTSPQGSETWVDLPDESEESTEDMTTPKAGNRKSQLPPSFVADLRAKMKAHPPECSTATNTLDPFTSTQAAEEALRYEWCRRPPKAELVDREQVEEAQAAAQGGEFAEFNSDVALKKTTREPGCQSIHAAGHAESESFDSLTGSSGSCGILTASSGTLGTSTTERLFNPTPGGNEMSSYEDVLTEAVPPPSGPQIRMDTTFEELEELSPMVW